MVAVSDNFKSLALAAGREVSCRIEAGDMTFDDSEILSFRFQDVANAEELAFGETAANRFHFELVTDRFIPLSAVIRPYVSFGGGEECPLGVFYIARRYRRRNRYSITCYDRMYRLDSRYETELSYPASTTEILSEICQKYEIEADVDLSAYTAVEPPAAGTTVREVIGYIAGLEGASAKFDRDGRLIFKTLEDCGLRLTRDNYKSLSLTQDACEIRQITMNTDTESYSEGEGTRLTAYIQYNPFADRRAVTVLYNRMKDFSYHGMEIEMQGLPFLEAGDCIEVQNDADNGVFMGIISEIDYEYDGGLWATLYSKSKNPIDDYDSPQTAEEELAAAQEDMSVVYYPYQSTEEVTAGTTPAFLFEIETEARKTTSALFFAQLQLTSNADCTLTLTVYCNDSPLLPSYRITLREGELHPVCLHRFLQRIAAGYTSVKLYASTDSGTVTFPQGGIAATVCGQCFEANVVSRSPNRVITEVVGTFGRTTGRSVLFGEKVSYSLHTPVSFDTSDKISVARTAGRRFAFAESMGSVVRTGITLELTDIYKPARTLKMRRVKGINESLSNELSSE